MVKAIRNCEGRRGQSSTPPPHSAAAVSGRSSFILSNKDPLICLADVGKKTFVDGCINLTRRHQQRLLHRTNHSGIESREGFDALSKAGWDPYGKIPRLPG